MLTKPKLVALLLQLDVREVHEATDEDPAKRISTKTIYRLRQEGRTARAKPTNPTLATLHRLEAACRVVKARRRGPARMKAKA